MEKQKKNIQEEKLNKFVFWREVIDALKEVKQKRILGMNFKKSASMEEIKEYLKDIENNPFQNYGRVCLALNMANEELQKINDLFKKELKKEVRNSSQA